MKDTLKEKLKNEGRSLKWFYDVYVKNSLSISYVYMTSQLGGFCAVTDDLNNIVKSYLESGNVKA